MTKIVFSNQPVTELFTYSASVTATDEVMLDGRIERRVTAAGRWNGAMFIVDNFNSYLSYYGGR
jgi:hypothetical protein